MHRNVQKLSPLTLEAVAHSHLSLWIDSEHFRRGYVQGLTQTNVNGFDLSMQASEAGIVEIVRNLTEIAQEGWLSEELLLHQCGVISGWLLRYPVLIDQVPVHHMEER